MKEDFLHYLWKFKRFHTTNLKTSKGEQVMIVNSGQYLQLSGPDFFNAQLIIAGQKWAGNIEIHLKSSDWYAHRHETDPAYENVILHVVWEHDAEIFRKDNTQIPVIELKNYVEVETLDKYVFLMTPKSWIFCERQIAGTDEFVLSNWLERLFFERLEKKCIPIQQILSLTGNDWEATLFCMLAKNFGLNTNGSIFFKIAQAIPFSIVRKESIDVMNLEALLFGMAHLLDADREDAYCQALYSKWEYLIQKYGFSKSHLGTVEFYKHRPDNFPTIRLAQLAALFSKRQNLFSEIIEADSLEKIYGIFRLSISPYWETHYTFDKESHYKRKSLGTSFVDLLLINTVIPIKFAYAKSLGKDISSELIRLIASVPPERNVIIDKFSSLGMKSENAYVTQSLLQLKNEYCMRYRCLDCAIGVELLKSSATEKTYPRQALPNGFFL